MKVTNVIEQLLWVTDILAYR